MKETTIYLPEETSLTLEQLADRLGRSQADLIQEAIEDFLARKSHLPYSVSMDASCNDVAERAEELTDRSDLRLQLQEGAIRRAERDRRLTGEWFDLEEEAWLRSNR